MFTTIQRLFTVIPGTDSQPRRNLIVGAISHLLLQISIPNWVSYLKTTLFRRYLNPPWIWRRWTIHLFVYSLCSTPGLKPRISVELSWSLVTEKGVMCGNCFVCWENYERVKKSCLVTGKVTVVWLVEFM